MAPASASATVLQRRPDKTGSDPEICPGRIQTEFYQIAIDDEQARTAVLDTGAAEITAAECADTILYAVNAAPHININRIELQPTEQTYGGSQYALRKNQP